MLSFHSATFRLLGTIPKVSPASRREVEDIERCLGFRLPASFREWYCNEDAIDILAKYSNADRPIPLREFKVKEWTKHRLLPFKWENQGVCVWAIILDGSDDPPVYVDVDSDGTLWHIQALSFSAYVYACVWDYAIVLYRPALVQAQNQPLSREAVDQLRTLFSEQSPTFGWPGSTQHRFAGKDHAVLIWAGDGQADWFVGALDAKTLEAALRAIWDLDRVGQSFYDCDEISKGVLHRIRGEA